MPQMQCARCGYTLAGTPGSMAVCPNCGQQTVIPGGSGQGWNAYPGGQQAGGYGSPQSGPSYGAPYGAPTQEHPQAGGYSSPQSGNLYGAPTQEHPQAGYGSGPAYGQPAPPYPIPQEQYGGQGGAFGPTAPGGYPSCYQTPPAPPRRNPMLPIALVVVLLLVAGGAYLFISKGHNSGVAKTPTPTTTTSATATPTTSSLPTGYSQYSDPNGLYTVGYPSDWKEQDSSSSNVNGAVFTNPDRSDVFEVATLSASGVSTSDLSPELSQYFTGFAGSQTNGSVGATSQPQDVQIAGQTWTQESGDINYTDASGSPATAHSEVAAISRNGHIYIIADVTEDGSVFEGEKSQYFTPMINTFAFK